MSFTASANRSAGADGPPCRTQGRVSGARIRLGAGAATVSALAAAAILTLAASAGAGTSGAGTSGAGTVGAATVGSAADHGTAAVDILSLRAMPAGTVTFGRGSHGRLTVHADMFGLTPGSSHSVNLVIPGRSRAIRFSPLTANSAGHASSALRSDFTGHLRRGGRLLIRMGVGGGRVAREPIAETRRLRHPGHRPHRLIPVEVSRGGISSGPPRGRATISYNAHRHTLTVTVHATRLTPGPHAAHIHMGSCQSQGPVLYMLRDLVANSQGTVAHAVRVFTNVTKPIPAEGWYLNIHQGNSKDIAKSGQPTILFRPLLCRNIH